MFRVISVLKEYRPDIMVIPVSTRPTGLLLLMGIDPSNAVLADHYDEIVARFRKPDPQQVPPELLQRTFVQPAHRLLASRLVETLANSPAVGPDLRTELRGLAAEKLGPAYGVVAHAAAPDLAAIVTVDREAAASWA